VKKLAVCVAAAGLWVMGALAQTPCALNLSHDLVANGIARQNMTPDSPGLDARPLFQAGVAYASANHISVVTADRGRYYFLSQNSPYQHVYLKAIANVTVDPQYSDLYFAHGNIVAIDVATGTNFTLKNFTVDYLQLSERTFHRLQHQWIFPVCFPQWPTVADHQSPGGDRSLQ
jgi:hypothetical protein